MTCSPTETGPPMQNIFRQKGLSLFAQAHPAPINQGSIPYAVLGCGPFRQPLFGFSQSRLFGFSCYTVAGELL